MIDIHTHILPELDDGPRDIEEALNILRALQADGVRRVVATPHVIPGSYENSSRTIADKIGQLREKLSDQCLEIDILPGAENYIVPDLRMRLSSDPGLTINNGKYLLVELPMQDIPPFTDSVLSSFISDGIVPVIAHPERNLAIVDDHDKIMPLVYTGALFQVNAGSLLGYYGKGVARAARNLLERNLAYFIASDVHNLNDGLPRLSEARAVASEWIGESRATDLFTSNPAQIVDFGV